MTTKKSQETDEETVYRLTNTKRGGWQNESTTIGTTSTPKAFHVDRNCRYIKEKDNVVPDTREGARRMGLSLCESCTNENNQNHPTRECPLCNEETSSLPHHLPKCDGNERNEKFDRDK